MGNALLTEPKKEKEIDDGTSSKICYGISSMQGWRPEMEDDHATVLDFDSKNVFFGVYDGHGGKHVAKMCGKHLHNILKDVKHYKKGQYGDALQEAFLKMDEYLLSAEGKKEIEALVLNDKPKRAKRGSDGADDDTEEVAMDSGLLQMLLSGNIQGLDMEALAAKGVELAEMRKEDGDEDDEEDEEDEEEEEEEEEEEDEEDDEDDVEASNGNDDDDDDDDDDEHDEDWHQATNMGCTAVSALISADGKTITVANAGDSRCVLSRKGVVVELSEDHKPTDAGEKARIYKAGSKVSDGRVDGNLNLSRSIGDFEYKQSKKVKDAREQAITAFPDIQTHALTTDEEFVILACDGIWDVLSSQEAVDFVREKILKAGDKVCLSSIASEMLEHCCSESENDTKNGFDNMTAVIVALKQSSLFKNVTFVAGDKEAARTTVAPKTAKGKKGAQKAAAVKDESSDEEGAPKASKAGKKGKKGEASKKTTTTTTTTTTDSGNKRKSGTEAKGAKKKK